jgi:ABC-type uncharacterized transport system permease subunit
MLPKRWERVHYIGVVLVVAGVLTLLGFAGQFVGDTVTTLAFGIGADVPKLPVPVQPFLYAMGLYFILAGITPFVPSLQRIAIPAMIIAGILLIPAVLITSAAGRQTNVLTMLSESLRLATPIALGSLAGIWSEKSGVVNIAVEGMMLTAACFGFTAFFFLQAFQPTGAMLFIAVLVAVLSGGLMALLLAWLSITFKTDQVVSGTVINILALGITAFVRRQFLLENPGGLVTLPTIEIPFLSDIPVIGPVLFENKPIFFMMFVLLFASHFVLFNTRWGLRTRAVGEHPKAADTVGINVIRTRYLNVLLSGMIAGLAGAWFSLETVGKFDDGMTAGKGFIALAAVIFGKWTPFGAFGGAMLFGFAEALGTRFQLLQVPVPAQFLQILPYIVTIIVTSGLVGRAIGPAAIGQPYEKK